MTPGKPTAGAVDPPTRVKWASAELLAAKTRQQAIVDHLGNLGRPLTPREQASLLLALRTIREISKHMAKRRGALPTRI